MANGPNIFQMLLVFMLFRPNLVIVLKSILKPFTTTASAVREKL